MLVSHPDIAAPVEVRYAWAQTLWMKGTGDQGGTDESKAVDKDALMKSKWIYYEKTMKKRGLSPVISGRGYQNWWKSELGVN